jgi:galactokinase
VTAKDFAGWFGRPPEVHAEAPGRVNLIGEHTDYCGGFVMPIAIPQRTKVDLAPSGDGVVRVVSANVEATEPASFELGREAKVGGWVDYVQGTVRALREQGFAVRGFDATVSSDVPIGAGLSSSAALEIALLRALREAFALDVDDVRLAVVGRRAENDFVGVPVGIMDQMASSLADRDSALFLDTRTLGYERLPIPESLEIVVVDSGVPHDHAAGEYRTRRAECELSAGILGVTELRDVSDVATLARLPSPLDRRARHVVTENARVLEAALCLHDGDVKRLGELLDASHASLRDDFEVSVPDVDRLVAIARADPDVVGARMTGGGFGGAIVAIAKKGRGVEAAEGIRATYDASGPRRARVLVP